MNEATIIYPHQLFAQHPAVSKDRPIYLVEEPLFMREFAVHRQKLLLHRLSMQAFYQTLTQEGYQVTYLELAKLQSTEAVFSLLKKQGITDVHCMDVTDYWLNKRI